MGVEGTIYAAYDWPDTMHEVVDQINENNLQCIDMFADSPAEIVAIAENLSGDVQSPAFFNEWSRPYFLEAAHRLHEAGKYVAVHVDGYLCGALRGLSEAGVDCADAVTPAPLGDLTPEQCRQEAGPDLILSGGVPGSLWLPNTHVDDFKKAVLEWLELKKDSPRLMAAAADSIVLHVQEDRIELVRDLVEEYGRY
jgi:uroporphyrinogen-III decarboxylase